MRLCLRSSDFGCVVIAVDRRICSSVRKCLLSAVLCLLIVNAVDDCSISGCVSRTCEVYYIDAIIQLITVGSGRLSYVICLRLRITVFEISERKS